jgi:alpha/beta hydrolase fold
MPELVADALALADRAGAGRFHLVGHDWGGAVAWHLAARHPQRVATLTAVSTPHPRAFAAALRFSAQPLRSAYIAFFHALRLPELALGAHAMSGLRLLLAGSGLGSRWVAAYAGALAGQEALAAALAWYRAAGPSTLRVLSVVLPTCCLLGSGDPALGRRATEATARWVTGPYQLHDLARAGHWLPELHAADLAGPLLRTCGVGRSAGPGARGGRRDAGRGGTGAGPAGLAAATWLARYRRTVLVLDCRSTATVGRRPPTATSAATRWPQPSCGPAPGPNWPPTRPPISAPQKWSRWPPTASADSRPPPRPSGWPAGGWC